MLVPGGAGSGKGEGQRRRVCRQRSHVDVNFKTSQSVKALRQVR